MLHMRNSEISVPFLSEAEIKKNEFEEEKQQLLKRERSQGSQVNEADLKALMDLGFTKPQVEEALAICDGNKDDAANYLMGLRANSSPQR